MPSASVVTAVKEKARCVRRARKEYVKSDHPPECVAIRPNCRACYSYLTVTNTTSIRVRMAEDSHQNGSQTSLLPDVRRIVGRIQGDRSCLVA
jgi:hypothetical protein